MHHLCISVGRNAAAPILKKLFSPFVCIMRFCKKKKLKSANVYARINFIFWKFCAIIFLDVSYETSGGTGSKHRSKNAVIGPFSPFGSYVVHTMGRLSLKQPKNPSKNRFFAFFRSDFWSFLRKILSEIVWGAFWKGKKARFCQKTAIFWLAPVVFQAFFKTFSGVFIPLKMAQKGLKEALFKDFWTDFTIGAGQKCRETDKRAKNKGSRADPNKKSDCFSGNSAKNWPCATIREWRADKERIKIVQRPFEIGENRNAPGNKKGKSSEMIREKLCARRRIIGKSK